MTQRLYYNDSYLREFDAEVIETLTHDGRPAVVLDRTAFYPTSGGQPFDLGTLGGVGVVEVIDTDDGRLLHVLESTLASGRVAGQVEWSRRFDHMQQHTGQHVLSAAFARIANARTESFHLSADHATIDLARELSPGEIAKAEAEANRIVWEDRPIAIRFVSAEEAASLGLRKESKRDGTLRLVDVEGFDLSACGGTHVSRTGAIGIIVVAVTERVRGGSRVTFLCGGRALAGFRALRDAVAGSVKALSVLPADLPAAIERLQNEGKDLRKQIRDFQEKQAAHEADALSARAESVGQVRLVVAALPGWDASGLKGIASRIAERADHVAVLLGAPAPAALVVARGEAVPLDAGAVLRQLVERHGGKGGGRPELAQGGGVTSGAPDVVQSAREILSRLLKSPGI
jgi:alanyl-tRNA synthetase